MANPSPTLYSVAESPIAGGRYMWPAWRKAMSPFVWGTIPATNTLQSLDPKNDPALNPNYPNNPEWYGITGHSGLVLSWGGACYDQDDDVFWLPLNGGHADYAGNEPYKIPLRVEEPTWEMVRPPSGVIGNELITNDGQEATGVYSDGRVRAVHAYNKPVFVPGKGPALSVLGNTSWSGQTGLTCHVAIDPVSGESTIGAVMPVGGQSSSGCCYDSLRHVIWHRGGGTEAFYKYDIAADSWAAAAGTTQAVSGATGMEYIPEDDVIVWFNDYFSPGTFRVLDCATNTFYTPPVTGSMLGIARFDGKMQPRWVPELNAIAAWHNTSNLGVINLLHKPDDPRTGTWVIDQIAPSFGAPSAAVTQGTYGRFFYSRKLGGFGLLNGTNQPIYFLPIR